MSSQPTIKHHWKELSWSGILVQVGWVNCRNHLLVVFSLYSVLSFILSLTNVFRNIIGRKIMVFRWEFIELSLADVDHSAFPIFSDDILSCGSVDPYNFGCLVNAKVFFGNQSDKLSSFLLRRKDTLMSMTAYFLWGIT